MSDSRHQQVQDKVVANMRTLFQEHEGRFGISEVWPSYSKKFKVSLSKKMLGLNKLSDLFRLYPGDFEMHDDQVFLRNFQKTDKYGMPKPSPLKPLWGSGAGASGGSKAGAGPSGGGSGSGGGQKGKKPPSTSTPASSKKGGRGGFSTSNSILVSSDTTDSDSSDGDVKVTSAMPPPSSSQRQQQPAVKQGDSGFLSFEVSQSQGHQQKTRETMVFSNTMDSGGGGRGAGPPTRGTPPMTPTMPGLGRGRALEMQMQMQGMQPPGHHPMQQQQQPPMAMRFPTPNLMAHNQPGAGRPHPGVEAAMGLQNQMNNQAGGRQSRTPSESENSATAGGPFAQQQQQQRPTQVPLMPPAPPPVEITWPPKNPKLGIPPGVPRERKEVVVRPVSMQMRFQRLTKEQVEGIAEECIETLVETGEHVSTDRIVRLLLQRFNANDLRDLNVPGLRFPFHLQCINAHERTMCRVNAAIEAFSLSRSLCTLYDLEQCMIEYCTEGEKTFEALRLGPLQCLPIVYDKFKFPQDEKIPDITTADVLDVLSEYLTKKSKWTERLDMEEVMAYFVDHYHVTSAYSLGIRIRSLPLAAQVLKKSHRDAANTRKAVVNRCMASVHEEVASAFHKAKANAFMTTTDQFGKETIELRRHYFSMPAEAVMVELSEKLRLLLSLDMPTTRNERKRHQTIQQAVGGFLQVVQTDPLAKALLHLAVCVGCLDLQEAAMELLGPKQADHKGHSSNGGDGQTGSSDQQNAKQPPPKASLVEKLKRYVERCLAQGTLTLSHLERIEEKLLEDFDFPSFTQMGFGRFLHFLLHDPAPKALLDECGGVSLGGSHHTQGKAHMTELLEFLRQCKAASLTQEEEVERVLCHQFQVTEPRQLGYGKLRHLVEASEKPGKHQSKDYRVLYEAAFCGKTSEPVKGKREVGMLGHQTRDAALACLQSCPLLEDLERWSHWSTVFEPQYGSLKDFLQKYGGVHTIHADGGQKTITTDIIAMETQPGCLLRLVSSTSPALFEAAVQCGDPRAACGHLASLVTANRGLEHTPLALLANHVRSALFVLHTAGVPGGPGVTDMGDPAIQFVLQCLLMLPQRLCVALANQMFLEPLAQVVGSTRSKTLLMEACRAATSPSPSLFSSSPLPQMTLARLGCMLGVQEWTTFLTDTFNFPPECVVVLPPAPRDELLGDDDDGGADINGDDDDESEESEEEDDDSSASFLSDVQDEEGEKKDEDIKGQTTEAEKKKEEAAKEEENLDVANKEESSSEEDSEDEEEEDEDMKDSVEKADGDDKEKVKVKKSKSKTKTEEDDKDNDDEEEEDSGEEDDEEDDDDDDEDEEDDDDDKEEKEPADPYRVTIDQIRRDEFGVGIELNEDGQRLMRVQQERLGRSLDRLSRDLYSKDTHFVLELVQNADDNSYPQELMASLASSSVTDECPAVRFIIDQTGVTVLNNESGFREKDVRALCDVGRSTKGKHKYGYIGQKGIGFKSVFRVTNRPEVHSGGYHLCFDVESGPMGYILPHWCDDNDPQEGWMTKIVLPLKEEMVVEARSLAARFNDIHPSLLLFLHRLRSIHITNKVEGSEVSMRRVDLGDNIVQIHHGQGGIDRWMVVKKQLDASAISLQAKSGVEVESTEIALAFPLKNHQQVIPEKQPVFAFLPLRSYGFRFIVQGDFDVPSSREDVDRDSSWNQWLRNEIHTLFIEAFEVFRAHPEFEGLQSLWSYLQFVPLEDEILDFFKPVATQILKKIRATPCMPTMAGGSSSSDRDSETNIQWKLPSQTVMVHDALVHEVISPELLERHLGLFYVHRGVAAELSSALTRSLGVESITSDHLVQVGRSLAAAWGDNASDDQVVQIAKWLACVYRSLDDFQENSTLINTLRAMRVIPLSTGRLVALSEVTVFMLSEGGAENSAKAAPGKRDALSVLREDLDVVHGGLTSTQDREVNSQVTKLLTKLDVKQLSPLHIVRHHILPVLSSDQWKTKDRSVLLSYLVYIKDQRGRDPSLVNMAELKGVARVLTNQGVKSPATDNIHFRPAYGVLLDLDKSLPGYAWTLVDEGYLPYKASKTDAMSWYDFLSQLGVSTLPIVRAKDVPLTQQDLASSPWAPFKDMWPTTEEAFVVADFACEELEALISNNVQPATLNQQMRTLFSLLDGAWDSHFARYTTAQLKSAQSGSVLRESIPSSFTLTLQRLRWVPGVESTVMTAGDVGRIEEKETLLPPSQLYIPDPQIKKLLAHTVQYLDVPINTNSGFSSFLSIRCRVETKVVHDALVTWGHRDPASPTVPATFCSTISHLKNVYSYLYENLTRKEAQDLFHHHAVIFVPKRKDFGSSHERVVGRMLGRDEVWWQDTSGLFTKYHTTLTEFHSSLADRRPVESLYRELAEPFMSAARLQREPLLSDFAELLTLLAAGSSLKEQDVLTDVLAIYSRIGHAVSHKHDKSTIEHHMQQEQVNKVVTALQGQKVLATKGHAWVSTADCPMLADDPEMERMFSSKDKVHFLLLEPPRQTQGHHQRGGMYRRSKMGAGREMSAVDVDSVLAFLALFGVRQLSEEVKKEEITELFEPCPRGQRFMHEAMPYIQRFLCSQYPELQALHHKEGMAARLKELLFVKTKKLQVRYSLKSLPSVEELRDEKCVIMGTQFYFHDKHVDSIPEVSREVARFFSDGNDDCMKDLRHFLIELHPVLGKERELQRMLKYHSVGPLPEGFTAWEVPEPIIARPPTPPPLPPPPPMPVAAAAQGGGGDKGEGPTLRAWPPPAPGESAAQGGAKKHGEGGKPMGASIWPPPQAPEEAKRRRELPSNLRMAPGEADSSSNKQTSGASGATTPTTEGASRSGGSGGGGPHTGVERQGSRTGGDGERGAGGEGGEGVRRQDSSGGGGGSMAGKRKSDHSDLDMSDSKRPASEKAPGDASAEADIGARMHTDNSGGSSDVGRPAQEGGSSVPTGEQPEGGAQPMVEGEEGGEKPASTQSQEQGQQQRRPAGSITRRGWPPFKPRPDQLQLPVWTQLASETEYEELGRGGDLPIPTTVTLTESSNRLEVGRWGEHVVYDYLLQQKQMHSDIYDIIWTNQVEETGKPYDFEVVVTTEEEAYTVYIEVKATRSSQKEVFEISANEVKFASLQGERYHIYRIFNAGTTGQVQLVRLTNVSHKMDNKEVRLLMVI